MTPPGYRLSILCSLGALPLLAVFASGSAPFQSPAATSTPQPASADKPRTESPAAFLTIEADSSGEANITFTMARGCLDDTELRRLILLALPGPPSSADFDHTGDEDFFGAQVTCPLRHERLRPAFSGKVDLMPLRRALERAQVAQLNVKVVLPRHDLLRCDPPTAKISAGKTTTSWSYSFGGDSSDPAELRFSYGYTSAHIARMAALLGILLLIPVAITLWLRRQALGAPEEAKPAVWFSYFRFLTWSFLGGIVVWWTAADLTHADEVIAFLIPPNLPSPGVLRTTLPWLIIWLPPCLVYFACRALSAPIHALRGAVQSRSEILRQSFWTVACLAGPFAFFTLAVAEMTPSPRVSVLMFVGCFASLVFARQRLARSMGLELYALTTGEIRDRAFAIAQKAGAGLRQLYILPAERLRMANAFAHIANNIFLTDYLLNHLSKREVNAVIGHEVAHLQKKHTHRAVGFLMVVGIGLGVASGLFVPLLPADFPSGPAVVAGIYLLAFFFARRNEFAADAGSFELTGDAESMITALARISLLNTMPIHWGRLDAKILSHPSTMRRIVRLARLGNIPETRIPELLTQAIAPPADTYAVPPTALPAGKVFSTKFKLRTARRSTWTMIVAGVAIPVSIALAAQTRPPGTTRWLIHTLGFVLSIVVPLVFSNYLPALSLPCLERRLRAKFKGEAAPQRAVRGFFVSLSPGATPLLYEGNWAWDVGLLSVSRGEFCYWGEEARFRLRREEIIRISSGPGPVSWFRIPAIYVLWRDGTGRERVFSVRRLGGRSMLRMAGNTKLLARELEKWLQGKYSFPDEPCPPTPTLTSEAGSLGPPSFGEVTSLSPRAAVRGLSLVRDFILNTFLAIGAAVLSGLRFSLLGDGSGSSFLCLLCMVWITRAVLFWPYFRSSESEWRSSKG
jgi:Zn-dependent protease with chaperone function